MKCRGGRQRPCAARAAGRQKRCPFMWQQAQRPALLLGTTAHLTVLPASWMHVHVVLCGHRSSHHHLCLTNTAATLTTSAHLFGCRYTRFYAVTVAGIITFGGLVSPILEVKLGLGGEPVCFARSNCIARLV